MSAALSAALLIAFVFGFLIQGSSLEWVSPYIDPAALALVCLVVTPDTVSDNFGPVHNVSKSL
jgi:predicted Co/Zn/Cd cation transporter (cation efflux family)